MAPTIQWQLPSPSKVRRTTALNKRIFLMLVGVIAVFSGSLVLAYHALLSSGSTTAQAAAPPSSHEHLRARSTAAVISAVRERLQAHGAEAEQQQPTRPEPRRRQSEVAAAAAAAAAAATAALAGPHRCLPIDGGPAVALPSALVDDDYCDCADGSDEPHTSACAGVAASARFACERDPSDRPLSRSGGPSDSPHAPVTIAASRVHDGVCDCCDGSDEPPSANCTSERCEVLEAAKSAQVAERLEGIRLRDALAARASSAALASQPMRNAPHAAFAALSGRCYQSAQGEYTYEVCLFEHASQKTAGVMHASQRKAGTISLGRRWTWGASTGVVSGASTGVVSGASAGVVSGAGGAQPMGVFSGGDNCWGVGDRSLTVRFACSAHADALGHIAERSTCVYEVTLSTAAAC